MYTNNLFSKLILEISEDRDLHFCKLLKPLGFFSSQGLEFTLHQVRECLKKP